MYSTNNILSIKRKSYNITHYTNRQRSPIITQYNQIDGSHTTRLSGIQGRGIPIYDIYLRIKMVFCLSVCIQICINLPVSQWTQKLLDFCQ